MPTTTATALATGVSGVVSSMGAANSFLWSLFANFLSMIMDNALIAVPVLLAVLCGAIGIVVKIIRRFGVKGRK